MKRFKLLLIILWWSLLIIRAFYFFSLVYWIFVQNKKAAWLLFIASILEGIVSPAMSNVMKQLSSKKAEEFVDQSDCNYD